MIKNIKDTDFPRGEEGNSSKNSKAVTTCTPTSTTTTTTTNSTPWLRLKDPRIVRVSRVFGGKDRHSKVCTIRGLRDRRVRLSVPTAIQLYHLQDRLGLNQPSKVVDWLLNAAKHEIDELPPLPIMPTAGNFSLLMTRDANPNACSSTPNASQSSDQVKTLVNSDDQLGSSSLGWSNFWSSTGNNTSSSDHQTNLWRARAKEVVVEREEENLNEKENMRGVSTRNNGNEGLGKEEGSDSIIIGNNNLLQRNMIINQHSFFPGNFPTGNYRWESPNYPLLMSHLGVGGIGVSHGLIDHNNLHSLSNVASLQPSTLSLSTGSQYLGGSTNNTTTTSTSTTTQTYFPNPLEIHDPRQQANHFQILSSNLSPQNLLPNPIMRSLFHFGMSNNSSNDNGHTSTTTQRKK